MVYGLGVLTLVSLFGLPGDIFYLWALGTNKDVSGETVSNMSDVFETLSVVFLGLTIFGLAASIFGFFVGGGFFVLLYFVAAEAIFLIPTGMQFAAAYFFNEYQYLSSLGV